MRITQNHLAILCNIADQAGREILSVYQDGSSVSHKADDSPLTEADLRADRIIRSGLEQHFPGVYILSEESRSTESSDGEHVFLVDPLDGTKEFIQRSGEFTVNIALVEQGEPIVGIVLAPVLNELYVGARGIGAWKRTASGKQTIHCRSREPGTPMRVVGSRSHGSEPLAAWLAALSQPHTFTPIGSSLKICRIAEGEADIYPRFGATAQWDTAAAHCVLALAGGTVTDTAGNELRYGLDSPLINPEFVAAAEGIDWQSW